MTLLRYWLAGTAIILAGIAVWALAPVLIFFVLLAAALGLVSLAMIGSPAACRPGVTAGDAVGQAAARLGSGIVAGRSLRRRARLSFPAA